jgi:REP-associated tyrosine transposase
MKSHSDPDHYHHRRSMRLKGYDYAQAGAYFVTICTYDRACLFGDIVDGTMQLNDAGQMVQEGWPAIAGQYSGIAIDAFVVMPNHIHGIIMIAAPGTTGPTTTPVGAQFMAPNPVPHSTTYSGPPDPPGMVDTITTPVGAQFIAPNPVPHSNMMGAMNRAPTVGEIVRAYKARVTVTINQRRGTRGVPVWQRNFYDHIIRDDEALDRIRQYIVDNPAQWAHDPENLPPAGGTR